MHASLWQCAWLKCRQGSGWEAHVCTKPRLAVRRTLLFAAWAPKAPLPPPCHLLPAPSFMLPAPSLILSSCRLCLPAPVFMLPQPNLGQHRHPGQYAGGPSIHAHAHSLALTHVQGCTHTHAQVGIDTLGQAAAAAAAAAAARQRGQPVFPPPLMSPTAKRSPRPSSKVREARPGWHWRLLPECAATGGMCASLKGARTHTHAHTHFAGQ